MKIKFIKMNSYGNNFVIIKKYKFKKCFFSKKDIGIGFDQLISFRIIKNKKIVCRIFNYDMSEANNCANGLRCLSSFIFKKLNRKKIYLHTKSGSYSFLNKKKTIASCIKEKYLNIFKIFCFNFKKMYFRNLNKNIQINLYLKKIYFQILSLGNFHTIFFIKNEKEIKKIFNIIKNNFFDNNISFMLYNSNCIKTFERGVGFTLSCGTGTFASCISYIKCKPYIKNIIIKNKLGYLKFYKKKNNKKYLEGTFHYSYVGSLIINDKNKS
ncbi:hypothetical protein ACWNX6_00105 [Candidatus Vidania fulgoroideorum]